MQGARVGWRAKGRFRFDWRLALICVASLALVAYSLSLKAELHNDEYTSYVIANNGGAGGMMFSPRDNHPYDNPETPYLEAMSVTRGFDFAQVYANDAPDTLPPLYNVLLHFVSSFFPGQMSIWFGGVINLAFMLLSIWMLYRLMGLLGAGDSARLLACLMFGLLPGIVEIAQFLRMYAMSMFWVLWLSCEQVTLAKADRLTPRAAVLLALPTVCGVLTHYYFILFAAFQCLVMGVWLLTRRRFKLFGVYVAVFAAAAAVTIGVYPGILRQLFGNWLMPTAMENLSGDGGFLARAKGFYFVINTRLFGGYLPELLLGAVAVCLLRLPRALRSAFRAGVGFLRARFGWVLVAAPCAMYFLFVSKIAFFANTRYMCFIYPLIIALCAWLLTRLASPSRAGTAAACLLCVVALISATRGYPAREREYSGHAGGAAIDAVASYGALQGVCVYNSAWQCENTYMLNRGLGALTLTRPDSLTQLPKQVTETSEPLILEIQKDLDADAIIASLQALCAGNRTCEPIADTVYYAVYLFSPT